MAKLTDRQRKQVIAERIEGASIRALAKKYKVSTTTIQNITKSDDKLTQKFTHKKEQNTLDMLDYMESRKDKAQLFIDMCFCALSDPEKMKKAQLSQITTAMGTVIDKFTGLPTLSANQEQKQSQAALLEAIKGATDED